MPGVKAATWSRCPGAAPRLKVNELVPNRDLGVSTSMMPLSVGGSHVMSILDYGYVHRHK